MTCKCVAFTSNPGTIDSSRCEEHRGNPIALTPTVPRVATSLDDLRVGQWHAHSWIRPDGHISWELIFCDEAQVQHYRERVKGLPLGTTVILSDPPPEPVPVPREALDLIHEIEDIIGAQDIHTLGSIYGDLGLVVHRLVDAVRGTE